MPVTWQVFVQSVASLKRPEYRVGDATERATERVVAVLREPSDASQNTYAPGSHGSQDTDGRPCADIGNVAVEAIVGSITKRTQPINVSGGQVTYDVGESLLLPEPEPGHGMTVRVLRVGHMQTDALVGEGIINDAYPGQVICLSLTRKGKGFEKGCLYLAVTPIGVSAVPVAKNDLDTKDNSQPSGNSLFRVIVDKRHRLADKYLSEGDGRSSQGLRQPLLEQVPVDKSVGSLIVAVESINGLKPQRPYLLTKVGVQEILTHPDKLASACEEELTHTFEIPDLSLDLCVYCYDALGFDRKAPVGRILLPLACLAWDTGGKPSLSNLKHVMFKSGSIIRHVTAQFMPVSGAGDGGNKKDFVDRFQAAQTDVPGSGMLKSNAFGCVRLRLELTLHAGRGPYLRNYFKGLQASIADVREQPEIRLQSPPAAQQAPELLSLLQSGSVTKVTHNIARLKAITRTSKGGLLRWLKKDRRNGFLAGALWFAFCYLDFFPPPLWIWPIYIWLAVAVNSFLLGMQQEADWNDLRYPVFPVWEEEISPVSQLSLSEMFVYFTESIQQLEQQTSIIVNLAERGLNIFGFADGTATLLCLLCSAPVALVFSLSFLALCSLDPTGKWLSSVIGVTLCVMISRSGSPGEKPDSLQGSSSGTTQQTKDTSSLLQTLDRITRFVPNTPELAHRYIAWRVQCLPANGSCRLQVTIRSATNLRKADLLNGTLPNPYCICKILGKPSSAITTPVVNGSINPEWKHTETLKQYVVGDTLLFEIFGKDLGSTFGITQDNFLGRTKITSAMFYPDGFHDKLRLEDAGAHQEAYLQVNIKLIEREHL